MPSWGMDGAWLHWCEVFAATGLVNGANTHFLIDPQRKCWQCASVFIFITQLLSIKALSRQPARLSPWKPLGLAVYFCNCWRSTSPRLWTLYTGDKLDNGIRRINRPSLCKLQLKASLQFHFLCHDFPIYCIFSLQTMSVICHIYSKAVVKFNRQNTLRIPFSWMSQLPPSNSQSSIWISTRIPASTWKKAVLPVPPPPCQSNLLSEMLPLQDRNTQE